MAKKRRNDKKTAVSSDEKEKPLTLSDTLSDDLLSRLAEAKKELVQEASALEEKRHEQKRREQKEKEKNKSFEELLEEYGEKGSKY